MANLIFPKRWSTKPPPGSTINWGHPLAQGLTILMPFNERAGAPPQNLIGLSTDPTENAIANMSWDTSQLGGAVRVTGATGSNWQFLDSTRWLATDRGTILFSRRFTDTTLRAAAEFGVDDPGSVFTLRCGAHVPFSDGIVYWDFGGVAAPNRLTWGGYTKAATPESWAFRAGRLGSSIWFNKQMVASQATAITRTASSNIFYINGGNNTSPFGDLQEWFFFAAYKTELPDNLIQWWMAEPFAMLRPAAGGRLYFAGPPAGGVTGGTGVVVSIME